MKKLIFVTLMAIPLACIANWGARSTNRMSANIPVSTTRNVNTRLVDVDIAPTYYSDDTFVESADKVTAVETYPETVTYETVRPVKSYNRTRPVSPIRATAEGVVEGAENIIEAPLNLLP